MKICLDACVLTQPMTGIARYTLNLIEALTKIDSENEYFVIFDGDIPKTISMNRNFTPIFSKKRVPIPFFASQIYLPHLLKKLKIDVFHCPRNWPFPFLKLCKYVVTVHDVYPLLFSQDFSSVKDLLYYKYYKVLTYSIPKKVDAIITVSENSKIEITRLLGIPGNRVTVIPEAADKIFRDMSDQIAKKRVVAKYNISLPFILHVGGIQSYKNTSSLIQAFHRLHNSSNAINHNLVIIGRLGRSEANVKELVNKLDLDDRVIFTGFVCDEDLVLLYNAAELFVHLSLYEGFCLPILEAMACGTPVLASNSSAIPEVTGNAGLLVDPMNTDRIAEGMLTLLSNNDLRQELRQKGLKRAKSFSGEEAAKRTLGVYERVYSQSRSI